MENNTENAVKTWAHGAPQFKETYDSQTAEYNRMTIAPTAEGLKEIRVCLSIGW